MAPIQLPLQVWLKWGEIAPPPAGICFPAKGSWHWSALGLAQVSDCALAEYDDMILSYAKIYKKHTC